MFGDFTFYFSVCKRSPCLRLEKREPAWPTGKRLDRVCPGEQEMAAVGAGLQPRRGGSWQEDAGSVGSVGAVVQAETCRAAARVLAGTRGGDFAYKQAVPVQIQYTVPVFAVSDLGC